MQPHKGLSSKDSFSPCQQADIFSHIRSPRQPLKPLGPVPSMDTLESEQEAIDRLILEKPVLRPLYFLAKTTKGIVVFILFPFHFFLFRTPKWMMTKTLPFVFQSSSKIILKTKEYLNRLAQDAASKLQVLKGLQKALKAFAPLLKSLFKEMSSPFAAGFKNLKENLEKAASATKLLISNVSNKIESLFSVFNKMGNLMKRAAYLVKESERTKPLFPFKEPINKTIESIKKGWVGFLEKGANELEKQKEKLEKLLLKAHNLKETGKSKILKVLQGVQEAKESFKERFLEIRTELKEVLVPKVEIAWIGMQKTVQVLNPPFLFIAHLMRHANKKGVSFVGHQVNVLKFAKSCVELSKKVFKKLSVQDAIIRSFQRLFQEAFTAGKKLSKKAFGIALKGKAKLKQKMQIASRFLFVFLKKLAHFLLKIFKKMARFFSLCCKWCRIMAKFTYYLGQEILLEMQTI